VAVITSCELYFPSDANSGDHEGGRIPISFAIVAAVEGWSPKRIKYY